MLCLHIALDKDLRVDLRLWLVGEYPSLWLVGEYPNYLKTIVLKALKKMFMCPKFRTYPVLKYTKCLISTNL